MSKATKKEVKNVTKTDAVNIVKEAVKDAVKVSPIQKATNDYKAVNNLLVEAVKAVNKVVSLCKSSEAINDDRAIRFSALNKKLEHSRNVNNDKLAIYIKNFDKAEAKKKRDAEKILKGVENFADLKAKYEAALKAKAELDAKSKEAK